MNYLTETEILNILAPQGHKSSIHEENVRKRYSELIFHNQEHQISHNSYMAELRMLECIEQGDINALEQWYLNSSTPSESFGTLAKDRNRNAKNLCIAVLALASRAAIRGGLHPEQSFSLYDCYVQEMEECSTTDAIVELTLSAERHFTELVHELRDIQSVTKHSKGSPYINRCKDYIFAHLHDKLTVQEVADALHIHPNYLSSLFKDYEGITIPQFILREKVNLAKNMLTYSDYTYSEIATYLGFSSQSHLGTQFRKVTGTTLHEYRTSHQ